MEAADLDTIKLVNLAIGVIVNKPQILKKKSCGFRIEFIGVCQLLYKFVVALMLNVFPLCTVSLENKIGFFFYIYINLHPLMLSFAPK